MGRFGSTFFRSSVASFVTALFSATVSFAVHAQVTFSDETSNANLFYNGESRGAAWVDFNGDDRPDIWANNHRERTNLYRNNGDGTFTNVVLQFDIDQTWTGLLSGNDTHGAAWADFDNDGDQDVYNATGTNTPPWFLVNNGSGLTEEATTRGIPDDAGGWMGAWFDYNRDGLLDLMQQKIVSTTVLRQNPNNTFTTVTGTDASGGCGGADWAQIFDLDDDGDEELLCMKNTFPEDAFEIIPPPWTDITNTLPPVESITDTAIADFDNDLRTDILILRGRVQPSQAIEVNANRVESFLSVNTNEKGFSFTSNGLVTIDVDTEHFGNGRIFIGAGGMNPTSTTFTLDPNDPNVAGIAPHTPGVFADRGVYVGLVNGEWQLFFSPDSGSMRAYFIVDTVAAVSNVTEIGFDGIDGPRTPRLMMNTVSGLQEEHATRGLTDAIQCNSLAAADYDNDGDVDFYAACHVSVENIENRLFLNDGLGNFTEVTTVYGGEGAVGAGVDAEVGASESVVAADYDVDGRIDVFVTNGARLRPTELGGPDQLFRNTTANNNEWVELKLVGTASNRDANGAKVIATSGSLVQLREQNGGYHRWSQHSRVIHFGFGELGPSPQITNIRVEWPSGFVDEFQNVDANRIYRVTERATALDTGTIQEITLGPVPGPSAPQPGDECGTIAVDPSQDVGLYISRDCTNNVWHLDVNAGGNPTNVTFDGVVDSDSGFDLIQGVNLEQFDRLDDDPDPNVMDFRLKVKNVNVDQVDFTPSVGGSTLCLSLTEPIGATEVFIGPRHLPVTLPVDLYTFGSCAPPAGTARIGDFVWNDLDADGVQETGEPGLVGVTVNLLDCNFNILDSTTTGSGGDYLFGSLPAGSYVIEYQLPAGFSFSPKGQSTGGQDSDADPVTGRTSCKAMADGQSRLGIDAGMTTATPPPTGQLGDFVWNDLDADGIQEAGEPGLVGVTVNLLDCSDVQLDTTTTGSGGDYVFANLAAGSYVIEFELPAGFSFSPRFQGPGGQDSDPFTTTGKTACKTLADGQSRLGLDAGMTTATPPPTGQLGDFVWNDLDADGIQEGGEPGLLGVTVNLLDCSDVQLDTTTTDGNGKYLFANLTAASYVIEFELPAGFVFSPKGQTTGGLDSDADTVTGKTTCKAIADGQSRLGLDAGMN